MPLLSVIVPVYNEAKTLIKIIEKIHSVDIDKEIIIVDDGSYDGTDKILRGIKYNNLKVIHHSANRGKGAAFLTGLSCATGEFVVIQDADLEYDPNDYLRLMNAIKGNNADFVLGARFIDGHQGLFIHRLGNRFLTYLINFLFKARLNDYATCYKLARRDIWQGLSLNSEGFDIDVEIVAKVLKRKLPIAQVPISYYPRSYSEGKKVRWGDGLWAICSMFKYRFVD
jgi:glycosyltransferase involved in cell wall biosynthesis